MPSYIWLHIPMFVEGASSKLAVFIVSSKGEMARKLLLFQSVISLLLYSATCSGSFAGISLDSSVQESAFKTLARHRPHTGSLYRAILPPSYAGMEFSVVRLRTRTLWRKGTNFSSISIPSRTLPVPHVKRLVIVYQDMGNWSSQFYAVPGYSLAASVVGFTVYDASNVSTKVVKRINLDPVGAPPIAIQFRHSAHPGNMVSGQRCVSFHVNGSVSFSEVRSSNLCYAKDQGRFSIVIPTESNQGSALSWVVGLGIAFVAMVLVCYVGAVLYRLSTTKKVRVTEKEATRGSCLEVCGSAAAKCLLHTEQELSPFLKMQVFPSSKVELFKRMSVSKSFESSVVEVSGLLSLDKSSA